MAEHAIVIDPKDSVGVALVELGPGQLCKVKVGEKLQTVEIREKIPFGHKFALRRLARGEHILKYGEVIGEATEDIEAGAWVHIHNLVSERGRGRTE